MIRNICYVDCFACIMSLFVFNVSFTQSDQNNGERERELGGVKSVDQYPPIISRGVNGKRAKVGGDRTGHEKAYN